MIALGLSLLFGMGWAVGLLASSDLPGAVRYPAEWIFTLATAFLGAYLFVLYVLRSPEARKLWKRWFLCQHKRKRGVSLSSSNSQTKSRLRSFSSTLASWRETLTTGRSTTNSRSDQRTNHSDLQPVKLELVEKLKPEDWYYSDVFSSMSPTIPPESAKGTVKVTSARSPAQNTSGVESLFSVAEEPTDRMDPEECMQFYNKVYVSQQIQDSTLSVAVSINASSCQSGPSLPGTGTECFIVENMQTEGSDITTL